MAPVSVVRADDPPKEKPHLYGDFANWAKELKLDDATISKLADVAKERDTELKAWDDKNTQTISKLKRAATDAYEAGNSDEEKVRKEDYEKLEAERKAIVDKYINMGFNILTPDQQTDWLARQMMVLLMKVYPNVKFTDDQKKIMRNRCADLIEKTKDARDEKVWHDMFLKLRDSIDAEILTDDQKKALVTSTDVRHP